MNHDEEVDVRVGRGEASTRLLSVAEEEFHLGGPMPTPKKDVEPSMRLAYWRSGINLALLSGGFFVAFAGYNTLQAFATTILPGKLGSLSLTVVYVAVALTVPVSPMIVGYLGLRTSMFVGACCYFLYEISTAFPEPWFVICSAILLGSGAGVLWVSFGEYNSANAADGSSYGFANGLFWSVFQMSNVVGPIGAGAYLSSGQGSTKPFLLGLACAGALGAVLLGMLQSPAGGLAAAARKLVAKERRRRQRAIEANGPFSAHVHTLLTSDRGGSVLGAVPGGSVNQRDGGDAGGWDGEGGDADDSGVMTSVVADIEAAEALSSSHVIPVADRRGTHGSDATTSTSFTEITHHPPLPPTTDGGDGASRSDGVGAVGRGEGRGGVGGEIDDNAGKSTVCGACATPPTLRELPLVFSCTRAAFCCCFWPIEEQEGQVCQNRPGMCGVVGEKEEYVGDATLDEIGERDAAKSVKEETPWEVMVNAARMLLDWRVWLLTPTFFVVGFELAFWTGAYTVLLGVHSIGYVLAAAGIAEVIGGATLGPLSDAIPRGLGRTALLTLGVVSFCCGLILIVPMRQYHLNHGTLDNIPPAFHPILLKTFLNNSIASYLAAALFGLGDCSLNTVTYSAVADVFKKPSHVGESGAQNTSLGVYTVFQFIQNIGSALGFLATTYLPLIPSNGEHDDSLTFAYMVGSLLLISVPTFTIVDCTAGRAHTNKAHLLCCSCLIPNSARNSNPSQHRSFEPSSASQRTTGWAKKAAKDSTTFAPLVGPGAASVRSAPPKASPIKPIVADVSHEDLDYYGE